MLSRQAVAEWVQIRSLQKIHYRDLAPLRMDVGGDGQYARIDAPHNLVVSNIESSRIPTVRPGSYIWWIDQ